MLSIALCAVLALEPARADELATLTITSGDASHEFRVEMATTQAQRSKGLMFRRALEPGHGMLFDFGAEQDVNMWMRNTYIPLDMLFAGADGVIHNIAARTEPFSTATIPAGAPTRYVLEVPAGTARALAIERGDRMAVPEAP